jgi:hypothetical protein
MSREQAYAAFNLFVLADRAIIPTSADTPSRYTISIEPVQVFDYRDRATLKAALEQAISRGIPKIPEPPSSEIITDEDGPTGLKDPIEPRYAGVANWDDLERKSIFFCIECYPSGYLIESWGRSTNGKWSDSLSLEVRLPASVGIDGLTDQIINHLKTRRDFPGLMSATA